VLLAVSAAAGGRAPSARADESIPEIGARVRAQVSGLWPGWHMGMFSRLCVEPPCYRVLLFGPTRIVERMLSISEIERLQVSSLYDGRTRLAPADPVEWTYAGETWREVPIDPRGRPNKSARSWRAIVRRLWGSGFARHFADCHLTSMGAPS
jgi:hypothetical protein